MKLLNPGGGKPQAERLEKLMAANIAGLRKVSPLRA